MRSAFAAAIAVCLTGVSSAAQTPEEVVRKFESTAYRELRQWYESKLGSFSSRDYDDISSALNFFSFSAIASKEIVDQPNSAETGWFRIGKCKYARVGFYEVFGIGPAAAEGKIKVIDFNKINWKSSYAKLERGWTDVSLRAELNDFISEETISKKVYFNGNHNKPVYTILPTEHSIESRKRIDFGPSAPHERIVAAARLIAAECKGEITPF